MEKDKLLNIADRLVKLREAKGMTQAQVAEAINMSVIQCSRIECAKSSLKLETAMKFAELYGTTVDYIVTGKEPAYGKYETIINLLRKMPDENLPVVEEVIACMNRLKEPRS